jgi:hypothetical protein
LDPRLQGTTPAEHRNGAATEGDESFEDEDRLGRSQHRPRNGDDSVAGDHIEEASVIELPGGVGDPSRPAAEAAAIRLGASNDRRRSAWSFPQASTGLNDYPITIVRHGQAKKSGDNDPRSIVLRPGKRVSSPAEQAPRLQTVHLQQALLDHALQFAACLEFHRF